MWCQTFTRSLRKKPILTFFDQHYIDMVLREQNRSNIAGHFLRTSKSQTSITAPDPTKILYPHVKYTLLTVSVPTVESFFKTSISLARRHQLKVPVGFWQPLIIQRRENLYAKLFSMLLITSCKCLHLNRENMGHQAAEARLLLVRRS